MAARTRLLRHTYFAYRVTFTYFHKAAYHRRTVGPTVVANVPRFENPLSTRFKHLVFANGENMIS